VALIDYTGSSAFGEWLETHARQALLFAEKAGVNSVVIDSTDDLEGMVRNLAFSLSLYSGQMCTTPQNIFIPKDGIRVGGERLSFEQTAAALSEAVAKFLSDPARAAEVLGAIQNPATAARIDEARGLGEVLLDSERRTHPRFPEARVRTPLMLRLGMADEAVYSREWFGPIAFVVAAEDTEDALTRAGRLARERGALTFSVYTADPAVRARAEAVAVEAGVSLACNFTGGAFVNLSAAFSDFHGTGANPAANASLTDVAFVASRFRVVQTRTPVTD